jgi:hypothetical protein
VAIVVVIDAPEAAAAVITVFDVGGCLRRAVVIDIVVVACVVTPHAATRSQAEWVAST